MPFQASTKPDGWPAASEVHDSHVPRPRRPRTPRGGAHPPHRRCRLGRHRSRRSRHVPPPASYSNGAAAPPAVRCCRGRPAPPDRAAGSVRVQRRSPAPASWRSWCCRPGASSTPLTCRSGSTRGPVTTAADQASTLVTAAGGYVSGEQEIAGKHQLRAGRSDAEDSGRAVPAGAGQAEGTRHQDLLQLARGGRHPAGGRRGQPGGVSAGGDQAAPGAAVQGGIGGPAALRAGRDQQPGVRPRGAARPAAGTGPRDQLRDRDGYPGRSPRAALLQSPRRHRRDSSPACEAGGTPSSPSSAGC